MVRIEAAYQMPDTVIGMEIESGVGLVDGGIMLAEPQGTQTRTSLATARAIPLRPIWRGLIINTLIGAALWFGLLTLGLWGWRSIRGTNRRLQGACVKCGYDLRGVTGGVCPECGTARTESGRPKS